MSTLPPRRLLLLVIGFSLWFGALLALYGVNAVGCAFEWPHAIHRTVLLLLLALHAAALVWITIRSWRRRRSLQDDRAAFVEFVGLGLTVAALAATLFTLAPSLVLNLCA